MTELIEAWRGESLPEGEFAAARLVAFPHEGLQPLSAKFTAESTTVERLYAGADRFTKIPFFGLRRSHVAALTEELPELMKEFRANFARTASANATNVRRLAPAYVRAYGELD